MADRPRRGQRRRPAAVRPGPRRGRGRQRVRRGPDGHHRQLVPEGPGRAGPTGRVALPGGHPRNRRGGGPAAGGRAARVGGGHRGRLWLRRLPGPEHDRRIRGAAGQDGRLGPARAGRGLYPIARRPAGGRRHGPAQPRLAAGHDPGRGRVRRRGRAVRHRVRARPQRGVRGPHRARAGAGGPVPGRPRARALPPAAHRPGPAARGGRRVGVRRAAGAVPVGHGPQGPPPGAHARRPRRHAGGGPAVRGRAGRGAAERHRGRSSARVREGSCAPRG